MPFPKALETFINRSELPAFSKRKDEDDVVSHISSYIVKYLLPKLIGDDMW